MKKIKILSLLFCLVMLMVACHDEEKPVPVGGRTVLMYLVGDNNISSDIYANIGSVERGLADVTSPGTFVIYWDGGKRKSEFPVPTLFKYRVDGKGKVSQKEIIKTYADNQNSVSKEVITRVLRDVATCCPSENYGLIFGSHATGWLPVGKSRSFGDDAGNKINIPDLSEALSQSDIHFDFILFDACLMSQVEVVYELRNVADYLILSPAEVLSAGFPYFKMTKYLLDAGHTEQNVVNAAKGFIDYYKNESAYSWATIAVIKTDEIQALANITNSIMGLYQDNLVKFDKNKMDYFQTDYGYGRYELSHSTFDFRAFIRELTDDNIPPYFEEQLERVVIYKDYVDGYKLVNINSQIYSGIGCYIPDIRYSNWNAYFKSLQWYSAAGWNKTEW
ncbi:clostripain-related cysteine peptidase [uncultured Bacteroides sp.]|uniref:clostripain-related cysteine peptidase n=1 Tax=uncultured Bacteroides sp. TaxID=162156 RepID=UPI00262BA355|nr:clostripain-related cysteine peptidase [uncultured Bacteroides sp.]